MDNKLIKKPRGTAEVFHQKAEEGVTLVLCHVKDNGCVVIGSNFASAAETAVMERWSKEERRRISVVFPKLLVTYNKNMGGTDKMDFFLSKYRIAINKRKFYFKHFNWLLMTSVFNAWILYRKSDGKEQFLPFLKSVALTLMSNTRKKIYGVRELNFDDMHFIIRSNPEERKRCRKCQSNTVYMCKTCTVHLHPDCFAAHHSELNE